MPLPIALFAVSPFLLFCCLGGLWAVFAYRASRNRRYLLATARACAAIIAFIVAGIVGFTEIALLTM